MTTIQGHTSLRTLSETLGLSQTTVSRALNGYPEVSETTRKRVIETANRLGYRPNMAARRLARGVAGSFGIVVPVERNILVEPLHAEFLAGVAEFAAPRGLDITLIGTASDAELETYGRVAAQRGVDGFILSAPVLDDPRVLELSRLNIPFVTHGRSGTDIGHAWVDIDNRGVSERAVSTLVRLGHRRVAMLNGEGHLAFAQDRRAGWRDALSLAGLGAPPALLHEAQMTEEEGRRAAARMLALPPEERPTAMLCASTFMALGVLRELRHTGLICPDDLSIIVHDDRAPYLKAEMFDPPLTAIQSSIREGGVQVAKALAALIGGAEPARVSRLLATDLAPRASTAPPPRAG